MAAQNSNSTSNTKSNLNSSGPPAVRQLKPKKEKIGTLTKMTVGEKNPQKLNKTILLVGETGAGKSNLINALLNYSIGEKREDGVWFQIIEEEISQTESQTSDVIVYEIFGFEDKTLPYSLTIIDTPGYGNTRGIKHDDIVLERLFDLFGSNDGVHEVDAVGLVMKASDNRLSDRLLYTFNTLMSLFGKDLEKNIVALITHSDGRRPKNPLQAIKYANIKCATNEENEPVYFLFDNCDIEDKTEKEEMTGMREFTDFLEKSEPQRLVTTVDVLNDRIRLTACIQNLQEKIKMIELKQTEIKQIQEALKKHEEKMKKHEKFTVDVDEVYKDKEPVDGGMWGWFVQKAALCCTVCEENCHYPGCRMVWKPEHCEVMKGGHCTVCTNKCPASHHVKEKWRYVTKTRKVPQTVKEMKETYEKNKSKHENKLSLLKNLEKETNKLTAEKSKLLDESYQHVANLDQFALKADSVSTYVHLDFLIEKMKETGDTEKVQRLEKMRSRVDEGTKKALRYKQETLEEDRRHREDEGDRKHGEDEGDRRQEDEGEGNTEKLKEIADTEKMKETGDMEKIKETGDTKKTETGGTEKMETGDMKKMNETGDMEKMKETGDTENVKETGDRKKLKEAGDTETMETREEEKMKEIGNTEKVKETGETEKIKETGDMEKMKETVDAEKRRQETRDIEKIKETGDTEKMERVDTEKPKENGGAEKMETGDMKKMNETGDTEKMKETGDALKMKETGDTEKMKMKGDTEQETGDMEKIKETGDTEKMETREEEKMKETGDTEKVKATGDAEKMKETGDIEKTFAL